VAFRGALSPEEASKGIDAALRNARGLLRDAELFFENGRWPRAASLAILAIEEAGKVSIIRAILLARSKEELKREWRDYRRHTAKNFMASFLQYAQPSARLEDLRPLITDQAAHNDIDRVKQLGFYTDTSSRGRWTLPYEIVGQDLARLLVETARIVLGREPQPMTSPDELRIWVKHLRPVWLTDRTAMKEHSLHATERPPLQVSCAVPKIRCE
jgi:AbiV family abortive infection protein